MKRFQFNLERVRQYRKLQMEAEQVKLEHAQARLLSLDHMEAELLRQKNEAGETIPVGSSFQTGEQLERLDGFRRYLVRMAHLLEIRRAEAIAVLVAQQTVLLEARRNYELLNRLKDRSRGQWQASFNREQEQVTAELYLARWKR